MTVVLESISLVLWLANSTVCQGVGTKRQNLIAVVFLLVTTTLAHQLDVEVTVS